MKNSLRWAWLVVLIEALWANAAPTLVPMRKAEAPAPRAVPVEQIDPRLRETVSFILGNPTLAARGPMETFTCRPEQYDWLLDNPDRAVLAWRRIGAKCVTITPRGNGLFGWSDDNGSEVVWQTVHKGPGLRVWLAEGKVRPGPLLPAVPVKVVLALHHGESKAPDGTIVMHHQADLFINTDSKTAALMTRMLGPSAHRIAENGLGQLQLFFSGISWYLDRHPEQSEVLLQAAE